MMSSIFANIWGVYLDTAFWLIIGLVFAGLIKAKLSDGLAQRWLGGRGFSSVLKATLIGAPLPLCSCGVLPAATGLRRAGASKEATVAFLISTPETGVDSLAVSYALLGPVFAAARLIAALFTAILTGFAVGVFIKDEPVSKPRDAQTCDRCIKEPEPEDTKVSVVTGLHYAFTKLLDDLSSWLFVGIVVAGLMLYFIPPGLLVEWGSGVGALFIMLLVGIPMYICAVASVPIGVALLAAGVSPGAVLVFLLAGPATNMAGLIVVKNELGADVLMIYLLGIVVCSLLFGYGLDWFFMNSAYDVKMQMGHAHLLPEWLKVLSACLLLFVAIKPFRNFIIKAVAYK